jgi:hypothetical protein
MLDRTMKELLIELVGLIRGTKAEKKQAIWLAELMETSMLTVFSVLCIGAIVASASAHSDMEFFEENRFFIRCAFPYARALLVGWIAFFMAAKPLLVLVTILAAYQALGLGTSGAEVRHFSHGANQRMGSSARDLQNRGLPDGAAQPAQ